MFMPFETQMNFLYQDLVLHHKMYTGQNSSSTSILVTWDEVPADQQNGFITNYTIAYHSQTENDNGSVLAGPDDRQKNLTNLQEYVNYNITVFASTVKGNGPASDPVIVRTDQDGKFSMLPSNVPDFSIELLYLPVLTGNLKFGPI